ncbi:unnamed protein product [Nippostrongylus brasiliensis]|uniref:Prenyltransferase alpha-alpha toroid domain-containing protein n=1 Tax=Nippostrongylus brasiliensis TaxID=27835 RepID=A0A3P7BIH9_NIPBR|nr:unnamed protein product [Nippostrongylus brasiliensis]
MSSTFCRITLLFFAVSALDLLGELDQLLTDERRQSIVDWIYKLQISGAGWRGFGGILTDPTTSTYIPQHNLAAFWKRPIAPVIAGYVEPILPPSLLQRPPGSFRCDLNSNALMNMNLLAASRRATNELVLWRIAEWSNQHIIDEFKVEGRLDRAGYVPEEAAERPSICHIRSLPERRHNFLVVTTHCAHLCDDRFAKEAVLTLHHTIPYGAHSLVITPPMVDVQGSGHLISAYFLDHLLTDISVLRIYNHDCQLWSSVMPIHCLGSCSDFGKAMKPSQKLHCTRSSFDPTMGMAVVQGYEDCHQRPVEFLMRSLSDGRCVSFAPNVAEEWTSGNLAQTYSALLCLAILGDDFKHVDREAILRTLTVSQKDDGSFWSEGRDSESDMRFVFCAVAICHILQDFSCINFSSLKSFIRSSLNYDGGIGQGPGDESHGGSTFCAIASLSLANRLWDGSVLSRKEIDRLVKWALWKQDEGFHGRAHKADDSYLLHTYFSIAAFSLLREPGFAPINASLNVSRHVYEKMNYRRMILLPPADLDQDEAVFRILTNLQTFQKVSYRFLFSLV